MNKRTFLKTSMMGVMASPFLEIPSLINDGKTTILFQGDSITDAGRDKASYYSNNASGMGSGYVHMAASTLLEKYPQKNIKVYNRGISGHKVYQLAARWDDDAIHLKPDVLSILIGVNDFWHTLSGGYTGTVETYENDLRALLKRTKDALPLVRLIMGEPFVVKGGTSVGDSRWMSAFPAYQAACKKLAMEFNATFIPYQSIYDGVMDKGGAAYWCPDGVHPSLAGARLMANAWVKAYES